MTLKETIKTLVKNLAPMCTDNRLSEDNAEGHLESFARTVIAAALEEMIIDDFGKER